MPAARATSSVEVPWNPVLANCATATRSTSARRSSAVIRVAGAIMSTMVSDDSLTVKPAAEVGAAAEALEEPVVGARRLLVAQVRVGVVVAAMAVLPAGHVGVGYDEATGAAALARRLAEREGELEVGVAVDPRLRMRPSGGDGIGAPHGEQVAEQRVDVTRACVGKRAPLVGDGDVDAAPAGRHDVVVGLDRGEQR